MRLIYCSVTMFISSFAFSQPLIEWQKCFGGTMLDGPAEVQQTTDGGYFIVGYTSSSDGDVTGYHPGEGAGLVYDAWMVKLDTDGNLEWQKCFGGSADDFAKSFQQTADGGFIVVVNTRSLDGDVTGNHGLSDACVVKLDPSGNVEWQNCLGGAQSDWIGSIQQTNDGGFVLSGYTNSSDGDVTGYHAGFDSNGYATLDQWIVKLDASGDIEWQKCLGGTHNEYADFIWQTSDGGYITAGGVQSNDGDILGYHAGYDALGNPLSDCWIVKMDASGTMEWQKCLGGSDSDNARCIRETQDTGFIVAGYTVSSDFDVTGNHGIGDGWIIKLDATGTIAWQRCIGGAGYDYIESIQPTIDGNYAAGGWTWSIDGDIAGNNGASDFLAIKLNQSGNIVWQNCYGGTNSDESGRLCTTDDGGYVLIGSTFSTDNDISGNNGIGDFFVLKLSSDTPASAHNVEAPEISVYPNPGAERITVSVGLPLLGNSYFIYDSTGKQVISGKLLHLQNEVSLVELPYGVYTLLLNNGSTTRVVKE